VQTPSRKAALLEARDHTSTRTLGIIAVGLAVLCFSASSSVVKWAEAPGSVIAFWRMLASVVAWWLIAKLAGRPPTWQSVRRTWPSGVLFGLNLAVFFTGVTRTSIAHAEFIGALTPLLLLPAGALIFGERIVWRALGWGSIAIVGVAVVLFTSPSTGVSNLSGDLIIVAAVVLWAGYLLASKHSRRGMDVVQFMASVMPVATLTLVPVMVVRGGAFDMTAKAWLTVGILLLLTGVSAHALIVYAQRHVPVATIGMLQVSQPALAVVWAYLILGESIRPIQVLGMLLVVTGLGLFTLHSTRVSGPTAATMPVATEGELAGPAG
jgi:drug/metabolite transporter (DMT)-like permease